MLTSQLIPGHSEKSHDWHVFLYKAAKGSSKAIDILADAGTAYMVALTDDPHAPETLPLTEYRKTFLRTFLHIPQPASVQEIADAANKHDWFPFLLDCWPAHVNTPDLYAKLWKRGETVQERDLVHDAVHYCVSNWSGQEFHEHIGKHSLDYNSLTVVAAMIFLTLTWPDSRP